MEGPPKPFKTDNILELQRLELALESAGIGTWEFELNTTQIRLCERTKKIFQFSGSDIIDLQHLIDHVHAADRDAFLAKLNDRTDNDISAPFSVEFRMGENNPLEERWVLCRGQAHRDPETNLVRILGTFTDISQQVSG